MRNKVCAGVLAAMAGGYLLRRQGLRWGATDEEVHKSLPGDEIVPHPMLETTHAVLINARAGAIFENGELVEGGSGQEMTPRDQGSQSTTARMWVATTSGRSDPNPQGPKRKCLTNDLSAGSEASPYS